ncbi:hypothetical protein HF326_03130 [Bacillus altitudinis MN12]|jgi:hypothetical protein|uniref:Uncharacterized protein n=3 Tax=Bacillus TaxID=1386 RepID=A0A5K1N6B2_BACAB|nr:MULTISPECIES: hypothetical protein [Bacillus]AMM88572.1 membrane protein [Bacillus pumilus]KML17486.1 membrane protein [Bacillus stratosphericus]MBY0186427.1 hypothetical protein [Bacillus aerophilus]CVM69476.1 Uncharacterised protein [Streptococcus pneumoniae]AKC65656.1 membrane protein [Bacillus altitudinis]
MQQHAYSRTSAMFSIFLPALLICVFFLWSLYTLMSAGPEPLAVLGVYTLPILMLSSITGLNQPTNIMISEDELKIGAFGRWHTYAVSDIKGKLFLKPYPHIGKVYVRVGPARIFGGRYWISSEMSEYKQLVQSLQSLATCDEKEDAAK